MPIADILAYIATSLNVVMLAPQVIRTWKTKRTADLSLMTPVFFLIACVLWVVYGLAQSAVPVIVANTAVGGMNMALIFLKLKYK